MKKTLKSVLLAVALTGSAISQAGMYTDDLSRCLIESSSRDDKATLVKWMFTSMALHPEISDMSAVTPQQRDAANRAAAEMFVRLMTETCVSQAKKAIQYEGPAAIEQGFNVFGSVAGKELFANPEVARGLAGLEQYMDEDKLGAALGVQ